MCVRKPKKKCEKRLKSQDLCVKEPKRFVCEKAKKSGFVCEKARKCKKKLLEKRKGQRAYKKRPR